MSSALAPTSLAFVFLHAAPIVAAVMGGKSLAEGALEAVPALARPAVQDLVYGVLRRHVESEALLAPLLRNPPYPEIHALLFCALLRLDTWTDAHTVVDQAVCAAGELEGGRYKGLVNGVLRNYLRHRAELAANLSNAARLKHPDWWVAQLQAAYPDDWQGIVSAGNAPPPMSLRVNRRKTDVSGYLNRLAAENIHATAKEDYGILLDHPLPVSRLPGFAEGYVSVQDLGAQRAAALLSLATGSKVLDACAAPGGKAAHLLERCDIDLTAQDIDPARCRQIEQNLRRLGLFARVLTGDALTVQGKYDAILADVPCSASGIARRRPDIKWLRRAEDIARFAKTQERMLTNLWRALAAGGKLLYATCSVFPQENGEQIRKFLARQRDARLGIEEQWLPNAEHDGFYYALIEKTA
ncbi:ribosomal RNA small subunit methyltransferase B [Betaproteobacteria bacterium]|nr:ribosomal RNA small subunit methyltransferase B [Betaproteobacteria bacterium]GHU45237.1 ribosomal RNA small subunit methyltransferase B [Betaproteobacteria bacterium]